MRHLRVIRNFRLGIKNLMLHAMRSLLTMLGVVFGVSSVIAMLSVGEGASRQAMEQIRKLGSNNIFIEAMKPVEQAQQGTERVRMPIYGLTYQDAERIGNNFPAVTRIAPAKTLRYKGRYGERSIELRVVGTTPEWFKLVPREVLLGRVLRETDMDNNAPVCVLTQQGRNKLLGAENIINQMIRIHGTPYRVVGIIRSEQDSGQISTPDENVDAYIPLSTARERYGDVRVYRSEGTRIREEVKLDTILVEVADLGKVESTAAAITRMLELYHKRKDYKIQVPRTLLRQAEQTKRNFNIVLGSIAGISLLVGGIGIMNIMLATVTERTREIGIRRAIGAKRSSIVTQFLIETTVLSVIGGLVGLAIGFGLKVAIEAFFHMPTEVPAWSIPLSLGISVGVGMVFGLYPAYRASRLDPIVALRHE